MSLKCTRADLDAFNAKKMKAAAGMQACPPGFVGKRANPAFALGRMKAGKMNKTESAWAAVLEARKHAGDVLWWEFEPMNLRLADKCFYQVDFLVMVKGGHLECHEVKGYWTDDALVKIKTAAAKFPFRFIALRLVAGDWEIREF